jgi:hypothetical protein
MDPMRWRQYFPQQLRVMRNGTIPQIRYAQKYLIAMFILQAVKKLLRGFGKINRA